MLNELPEALLPDYSRRTFNGVQSCINFFAEKTADGYQLISSNGRVEINTTAGPTAFACGYVASTGQIFFTAGGVLYEFVPASGLVFNRGAIGSSNRGDLTMADDGYKMLLSNGYVYDLVANTHVTITDPNFPAGTKSVAYMDGAFLAAQPNTETFFVSEIGDPTVWTPAEFANANAFGDKLQHIVACNNNLYMFGRTTIEVWYNSRSSTFIFDRLAGATQTLSLLERVTCKYAKSVYFITTGETSQFSVWRLTDSSVEKISTPQIEQMLSQMITTLPTTILSTYNYGGHVFLMVSVADTDRPTLFYDITEGLWFERTSYQSAAPSTPAPFFAAFACNLPSSSYADHAIFFDKDTSAISSSGTSLPVNDDDGNPITRERTFGPLESRGNNLFHSKIRFELESLHDIDSPYSLSATLEWSDNAGKDWSTPLTMTRSVADGDGQLVTLEARRLGSSRQRYYKIKFVGPAAKIIIKKVWLDATEGDS